MLALDCAGGRELDELMLFFKLDRFDKLEMVENIYEDSWNN
jgi:hypothetical protein